MGRYSGKKQRLFKAKAARRKGRENKAAAYRKRFNYKAVQKVVKKTIKAAMPTYISPANFVEDDLNPHSMTSNPILRDITPICTASMIDGEQEDLTDGNIETFAYAKGLRINWSMTENNLNYTNTNPDRYFRIFLLTPRTGEPDAALTLSEIDGAWVNTVGENDVVPWHSEFLKRGARFSCIGDTGWRKVGYQESDFSLFEGTGQKQYTYRPQHGRFWVNFKNKKVWRPTRDLGTGNTLIGIRPVYVYMVSNFTNSSDCPDFKVSTYFYYKTNLS